MKYRFLQFPGGKMKAVTLSYDDGYPQDLRFSDVITHYGLKCTFNLTAKNRLTPEQVREYMLDRGHEIAVHGAQHRAMGVQRPIDGIKDVLDCRKHLESTYDIFVRGMAYPDTGIRRFANTAEYGDIKQYLTDLGIVYSRTLGGDNSSFTLPTDWHAWMPTAHHGNPALPEWIDKFLELDYNAFSITGVYPRLLYIWGHSFEFENNHNWDVLYKICEKISGREDIWYATNMEIYEYVTAYHSLIYSADGTVIYNPTRFKIWFVIDKKPYVIESGETLRIQGGA